ncbi:MAG TPA: molybdenum cofactor biosynthesis protein B [Nannocystaceae bacterium]|nr:molybdenum cofactor biosynthesis protein B [Nannocystaceae bacterium]
MAASNAFEPLRIAVLTVSDTRTIETDTSGRTVIAQLGGAGHTIVAHAIVRDDLDELRARLRAHIDDPGVDVVITTGGTGVTARDVTPEALAPLVDKPIPGFGELFRWLSYEQIGAATIQSRAEAALCGGTYVFLLPGSTRACELALERILIPQLDARTKPCNFVQLMPRLRP